jgi:hypothetical protein
MVPLKSKPHYSATEAARHLGISFEELQALVIDHIVEREEDAKNLPRVAFQPSDVLLLKLVGRLPVPPTTSN